MVSSGQQALTSKPALLKKGNEPFQEGQEYLAMKELGDCHNGAGNYVRAAECYRQAAQLQPNKPDAYVALGASAVAAEDWPTAQSAFGKACDLGATNAEVYSGLALVCQRRGQFSQAFDWYLKCLEKDCDNLMALLGLFQASCQMGTFAKIIRYLEVYLDIHPRDSSVMFCLATLYAREGRLHDARRAVLQVLVAEPQKDEARQLLAQIENHLLGPSPAQAYRPGAATT